MKRSQLRRKSGKNLLGKANRAKGTTWPAAKADLLDAIEEAEKAPKGSPKASKKDSEAVLPKGGRAGESGENNSLSKESQ